jgi:hypothetical protein
MLCVREVRCVRESESGKSAIYTAVLWKCPSLLNAVACFSVYEHPGETAEGIRLSGVTFLLSFSGVQSLHKTYIFNTRKVLPML